MIKCYGGKRLRKSAVQITTRRWMSIGLCAMLALSLMGNAIAPTAFAAEDSAGLCPHHESHDESCGWQPARESSPCAHVHDESCGYTTPEEGTPCTHEHDDTCGYTEGTEEIPCNMSCTEADGDGNILHDPACAYTPAREGTPCTHEHDETCGYSAPKEGTPCTHVHDDSCGFAEVESSCAFLCEWCITAWEWNDEEGALAWSEDTGMWGLGMPGASREHPVTREILEELLPRAVTVQTAVGSKTVDITWDLSVIPKEGVWEGDCTLTASLPGEYVLTEGVPALEVLLALGGGEVYDLRAINLCEFIPRTGTSVYQDANGMWSIDIRLPAGLSSQELAERVKQVLPSQVRGYAWASTNLDGYTYESTPPTHPDDAPSHVGRLELDWGSLLSIQYGENILTPEGKSSTDTWEINRGIGAESGSLQLKAVIQAVDLSSHTVTPAAPQNVRVNLFDYWVKTQNPTAPNGDILDKSDMHYHEDGGEGALSATPTGYSTVKDWNLGINQGHLLLFGDGLIHAGLWNKGAGENCRYGKTYAGMEGIVKSILPESGYPEINTANAQIQMMGVTDAGNHNYRNHELIKDWKLAGDHNNTWNGDGYAYTSDNIQNLSDTVIGTWDKDITMDTESLQYLFEPEDGTYKKSYEDVTGLFQLDDDGYYYYDMRKNFAEFSQEGGTNHFVLYDAPATVRTDASASIGNFFPFNKGSEVFTGMNGNRLTSSVDCSRNTMNHHLGMTVDVDFRQPVNGLIGSGTNAQPMTFQFSGDDDVWVFIDDVLVLDLGGIHSEIYGIVDFASGNVVIGRGFASRGIPNYDPAHPENTQDLVTRTTLRELFDNAKVEIRDSDWKGNTFASNTTHTLKMFYLERGNYDSSIALRFNLQPLLYQNIVKVDQNGTPLPGVEFELYPARSGNTGDIQCLFTDNSNVQENTVFYVTPDVSGGPLVTLTTDENGSAVFHTPEGGYFNFADLGSQYYVLRETNAPGGYRAQPIDIALYYDAETSMLSVANRWTTGAYACSVSNITGPQQLRYANGIESNGQIISGSEDVPRNSVIDGLVVAVPLLKQHSTNSWMALYGSNLTGFGSVKASGGISDLRGFVLQAALEHAGEKSNADWHLDWDAGNAHLYGKLYDLPGLASRYLLYNPDGGDMQMIYGIFSPAALAALGITGDNAAERYDALREYVAKNGVNATLKAINGVDSAFRLISVDRFIRDFRSLIYIPNERRELRVLKIDQDGKPLQGTGFGLFDNPNCGGIPVSSGTTDQNGMLIFSPTGSSVEGQARMVWANSTNTRYYLKETVSPGGYPLNKAITPVVVGTYGIYADAGVSGNGISVVADVGRLTQTMRQYAMGNDVDVTLRDLTAFMQVQPSGSFKLDGWTDAHLEGTDVVRSMNLHFERNEFVDYGLHDQDGGKNYHPFFVTDTGFVRTRIQQNYDALTGGQYDTAASDANKDNLGDTDLTNLFSLLNMVVVTDRVATATGELTISKKMTGEGLTNTDYTKLFSFTVNLTDSNGVALDGTFDYYFYGTDKAGKVTNGQTLFLHHDESLTILGLPSGTRFTVTETPETGWYMHPQTGAYSGEITAGGNFNASFTNSRQDFPQTGTGGLTIQKTVTGSGGDKAKEFGFTVRLTGKGDFTHNGEAHTLPCELSFTLKDGESIMIDALPAGTTYVVTESGNEGYTVTNTGNGGVIVDGTTSTASFVNHMDGESSEDPTKTQVTVKKVWVLDNGGQIAPSVTVGLYRNGIRYGAAELNAGNGWTHTWSGLDSSYVWTVGEPEVPDGFISSVSKGDGLNFTITNDDVSETPPENPDNPGTTDNPNTPVTPDNPGTTDTPGNPDNPGTADALGTPSTPDNPDTPNNPKIPQTGVNWWPTWLLTAAGVLLILAGIVKKLRSKGKNKPQIKGRHKLRVKDKHKPRIKGKHKTRVKSKHKPRIKNKHRTRVKSKHKPRIKGKYEK